VLTKLQPWLNLDKTVVADKYACIRLVSKAIFG
jgi:hypothetical protein